MSEESEMATGGIVEWDGEPIVDHERYGEEYVVPATPKEKQHE